jgi:Osmosensitive K+ channel histidine kinase
MVATEKGYRSIILLQYISDNWSVTTKKSLLMIFLYLSGIAALYSVSRWIVGKSLKPVEESRRRQTEFIAAASHELKSPLAVIRANASALKIEPERTEHFTEGIDKECMRLSSLIEDLLLLASVDANKWKVRKEYIDMDLLLIETYDTFQPFCREHHKELKLELQEQMLPKVQGDILRIRQVLSVLLDNAASYSKDGDTIILRAFVKKNQLMIEVEDHGAGINQEIRKEVFERFYKGDKSRRDKSHFGLGLSIAKELIELHDGRISFMDTQGGGVTFVIGLPTAKAVNGQTFEM